MDAIELNLRSESLYNPCTTPTNPTTPTHITTLNPTASTSFPTSHPVRGVRTSTGQPHTKSRRWVEYS